MRGTGTIWRTRAAVRSADSAEPASSGSGAKPGLSKALVISIFLLGGLAYRRLLFWDPHPRFLLPRSEGWFYLPSDTVPHVVFAIVAFMLYSRRDRIAAALRDAGSPLLAAPLVPYNTVGVLMAAIMAVSGVVTLVLLPTVITYLVKFVFKSPRGADLTAAGEPVKET